MLRELRSEWYSKYPLPALVVLGSSHNRASLPHTYPGTRRQVPTSDLRHWSHCAHEVAMAVIAREALS